VTTRKRLVATLIVSDGWIVNAYEFDRFLPVGRPRFIVEELERWEVDEFCVLDVSGGSLAKRSQSQTAAIVQDFTAQTPLSFGGGIDSVDDARAVIAAGAERVVLGGAAFRDPELIWRVADELGEQAVVVSTPFRIVNGCAFWCMPRGKEHRVLSALRETIGDDFRGEVLLQSMATDGRDVSREPQLFSDALKVLAPVPCMVMGGIGSVDSVTRLLAQNGVSAVCVGNQMHAKELLSPRWKAKLTSRLRPYGGGDGAS